MKDKLYAVLSGDLVASSRLAGELSSRAMQWLSDAANRFGSMYPGTVVGEMDTFRHDSWQLLMANPALSLRLAIFLRASLITHSEAKTKFDSRVSIGVGKVEIIAGSRISDSRGQAFTISGKNLDAMERVRMTYEADADSRLGPELSLMRMAIVPLLDCVVTDWTPHEARAVCGSLESRTQEEIAKISPPNPRTGKPITRQAVADALDRGHWGIIVEVLRTIEGSTRKS